ncbi:MAG: DMT family transporter [Rhodospirillales bacterium]|nr:DMT family transporter [Rhodospirillales bacterium]
MALSPTFKGILLVIAASLCWSLGGLIARSVAADGITIVFFRSLFMMLTIALYLLITQGRLGAAATIGGVGWIGVLSGGLLAASFLFYILSITHTLVANAYVLMSASPFAAALLARLLLKERLSAVTLAAMILAFLGIALMVGPDLGGGQWLGNLFAFGVAMAFGANVVLLRKTRGIDMMPAALLGGLFSALATLPFAAIGSISAHDLALIALMGVVQLGSGLILFTRGAPLLSAAHSSLLTLTESVAAPIWVWLVLSETPGLFTLLGGALVLAAVAFQTLASSRPQISSVSS